MDTIFNPNPSNTLSHFLSQKPTSHFFKRSTKSFGAMATIFNPNPSNTLYHFLSQKPTSHFLKRSIKSFGAMGTIFNPNPSNAEAAQNQNTSIHQTLDHKFIINGGSKLSGHVNISGSKNSSLALLAGTLCCFGTSKLNNVPNVSDTKTMVSVLESLGAQVDVLNGEMLVNTDGICSLEPCSDAISKIRGGFFVLGPLLARFGEAVVSLPGGCDIGARPVDLYIRGLRALGAVVECRHAKVYAHAVNGKGLIGGSFRLDFPSVGATETLMMAASLADGKTVLSNVAREPEVVDLAQFLNESGACIEGAGSSTLVISGRNRLHGPDYTVIPDRIEVGTFMFAAAITRSCFSMSPVIPSHLPCVIDKLSEAGCKIRQIAPHTLEISAVPLKSKDSFRGVDVRTGTFPQFPTDLQPQLMAFLTTCNGSSTVEETVFEGRMTHVKELKKLGAGIQVCGSTAMIHGKEQGSGLYGSRVLATDLRSGASLVLAGMAAEGTTEIEGVTHIDRGYEGLDIKLRNLGAEIRREPSRHFHDIATEITPLLL